MEGWRTGREAAPVVHIQEPGDSVLSPGDKAAFFPLCQRSLKGGRSEGSIPSGEEEARGMGQEGEMAWK